MLRNTRRAAGLALLVAFASAPAAAQTPLTTPRAFFGFDIGDDYHLANYQQISAYWRKLADESERMVVTRIGTTAEGRPMLMAIVSSPDNIANLERYQAISRRLALAEGVTETEARALADEGRAVVWIDGGLHATEVLGAHQLTEMVWQMVSRTDDETLNILDNVITLFVHANPDGNDLVADWYNRNPVPEQRTLSPGIPRLYQKYIGHDNNRDFFGSTQPETEAMNRVMYHEWLPQIVYNHHQTGPQGTVMFAPPFRDPFNYYFDPLLVTQLDLVAAAMHSRFAAEGKPGVTMRSGARYSTWWNGGLRTTAYFHNMIGILTETIGNPTPMRIPYVADQVLPRGDLPNPIEPQEWHFRQSIEYSITANRAILDLAARNRENFLFNIWRMGMNAIERGSRDSWTITPSRIAAAEGNGQVSGSSPAEDGRRPGSSDVNPYDGVLRAPEARDPRAYVVPSDQADFLTATKFINALREVNVTVHRATAAFEVAGKRYPAGSYVVFTAQAFGPHVLDMFEPQDHPDDFAYPGAPPTAPYDNAGWTLAYQMGIEFDRILERVEGPFERLDDWNVAPPPGTVTGAGTSGGYLLDHRVVDAFRAVNTLLANRADVHWTTAPFTAAGRTWPAGTFVVSGRGAIPGRLEAIAKETGVSFAGVDTRPPSAVTLRTPRIALLDVYGGSMTSGWTRWVLEQFGFPHERTYPPRVDAGGLDGRYDVVILPSGVLPDPNRPPRFRRDEPPASADDSIEWSLPPEYQNQRGRVTETTLASIRRFVERGGVAIAIGSSASALAGALDLPVSDHLVADGEPLPRAQFYVPGSILRAQVDTTHPLAAGLPSPLDVFFDESPAFRLDRDAAAKGVTRVAWYEGAESLRSGWAWGQEALDGAAAVVAASVGRGKVYLFGPEILQRGQSHGTFPFLFNAIYWGSIK